MFLFLFSSANTSFGWRDRVVGVIDGDSITVMHDGRGEEVRLYGIDCPEKRQDFGQKAKEFTSTELFGKMVEVTPVTTDRYGRTVAMVALNGRSFNRRIIEVGSGIRSTAPGRSARNGIGWRLWQGQIKQGFG